uniref:Fucolectin tachylectin-4 pentraxin-1 domain-containing protein n=1 Tax=Hucho hucho TaxID=62062 RepID=A0A4W5JSJ4_9TELE
MEWRQFIYKLIGVSLQNVALSGVASESSQYGGYPRAHFAIDGKKKPSCSHSVYEASPWWRVDLLDVYRVITVNITSRADCCPGRLNGAEIRIGNSLENNGIINTRCGVIYHHLGEETHTFQCNEMEGRYITVVIPGPYKKYLILCEVEVYGLRADTTSPVPSTLPPSTSASKKPDSNSSNILFPLFFNLHSLVHHSPSSPSFSSSFLQFPD